MTPDQISLLGGAVLSLLFEYFPYLESWYNGKDSGTKRLLMLAAMFVVVAGAFGLSCANLISVWVCSIAGAWQAVVALAYAVVGNQGVHALVKKSK